MLDERGRIINHIIAALTLKVPRAFLLENVKGLVTQRPQTLENILGQLRNIAGGAYLVRHRVIDTADHGLPQHRERVYIVGLLGSCLVPATCFTWPKPRRCTPLPKLWRWGVPDRRAAIQREKAFVAKASPKLKLRLKAVFQQIKKKGVDLRDWHRPVVVDIDGSKPHWMHGISPCLTRTRAATGHYLPALGRRMYFKERLLLQGLPSNIQTCCRNCVSERQLGAMIGNSLSLNVIEALLSSIDRKSVV